VAFITLDVKKLTDNFHYLKSVFSANGIKLSIVTKLLSGHREYLTELLNLDISQICDSRITNLKMIKSIRPDIETIYIKPPAKRSVANVVKYADISMNTEIRTIQMLSAEAGRQKRVHKIIIMIEMGELREGVMRDDLVQFYADVFNLPNIEVVGIGTNLSCLYGVLPNHDKLVQLSLYKQLIEAKFNKNLMYVSGGSSVTIPLIFQKLLPKGINHFRVGETLFLGTDVYNDSTLKNMHHDVFKLYAEIIELTVKPMIPMGDFGTNLEGNSYTVDESLMGKKSHRAIIDIGLLDVDQQQIKSVDPNISIVGASSDMLVIDLGTNEERNYKVGDVIEFTMKYMGVLRIMNSKYIEKKINR